jgi:hypothetical protein
MYHQTWIEDAAERLSIDGSLEAFCLTQSNHRASGVSVFEGIILVPHVSLGPCLIAPCRSLDASGEMTFVDGEPEVEAIPSKDPIGTTWTKWLHDGPYLTGSRRLFCINERHYSGAVEAASSSIAFSSAVRRL